MSTHNLCFEQEYEKYQNFLLEIFPFLVVKFSVYLNRCVFVMRAMALHYAERSFFNWSWKDNEDNIYEMCPTAAGMYLTSGVEFITLDKRAVHINIFPIFQWKHMLWVLIRSASLRHFWWVPTAYVFMEKFEKIQYILIEKKLPCPELWLIYFNCITQIIYYNCRHNSLADVLCENNTN